MQLENKNLFKADWEPIKYLNKFYSPALFNDEERIIASRLINFVRANIHSTARAIDVGCGPTVHHAAAIAPYVAEIHLADYLKTNLEEIRKWLKQSPNAFNWNVYFDRLLAIEKHKKTLRSDIEFRENIVRDRISKLIICDISKALPLGGNTREYDFVMSFFCADSITDSKESWQAYMHNIFSLVAPGGHIFMTALMESSGYKVGRKIFPSANITEEDMRKVLKSWHHLEKIDISVVAITQGKEVGTNKIIFATGRRAL